MALTTDGTWKHDAQASSGTTNLTWLREAAKKLFSFSGPTTNGGPGH